ncbi:tyrosine-type recombinase/integrase [Tolypothrix sp. PCC 7601]|uniref:tyrosine-type recombinase/integrase n=1 Tax=Tolypothrix sp. PCC 7601 TaxID=1188 RepID=UPI0005EABB64|nr:tyrosine-type recombinase/integrase [Tolypothrix sp. PCC 7601]EKE98983.1 putative integrase [Tolypothrix sp. PCC 7601]UYD35664.1 tyrosine-type recombinase/integrase [Tolypothrix sp. PCC 7601]BAY94773.1 phage integrase family protein [Microchaete diplosiphon NIES-3275]
MSPAASEDKWINVDPRTRKLSIRFRVRGFDGQFYISTGLSDTKRNREIVRTRRDAIANDITLGRFDSTLDSYQFHATAIAPAALAPKKSKTKYQYNLQELWERFTEFQSTQLEETTIRGKYRAIERIISQSPTQELIQAPKIRDWLLATFSHFVAWESLSFFSRCCAWAVSSQLIPDNPFANLKIQKPKRKSTQGEDFRAFTLEQRDLIIETFEQHHLYCHYAPLIKFLFWTGCRPGEAFALSWADISSDCRRITFDKSCNYFRIMKGTKNGKRRVFPCQSGSKLQHLLLNLKQTARKPSDLVFLSKGGKPITTSILFDAWNQRRSGEYRYTGVVRQLASEGKCPYLKMYATRHTFATWAISCGVSPDKVALWIGDNVATVLKYYCHPETVSADCPDF